MKEKTTAKKDYQRAFNNACNDGKFKGCLFIFDDECEKSLCGEQHSMEFYITKYKHS